MSFPAQKLVEGWAVKTPRGRLLIFTISAFQAEARMAFRGHLGLDSWAAATAKGFRLVRVVVQEPREDA